MYYPLVFKLLLVFIFFLPLRGVQIPVGVFGFEINPSRIVSVLFTIAIFFNICLDINYLKALFRSGRYYNPYVFWLFIYFLFSIVYYYILVAFGKTILFGSGETMFLRNWQGRPIAQLLSFITYGLVPFYLVKFYAQNEKMRRAIERTVVFVILLLLGFACLQVVTYIFLKAPLIGRQLMESRMDLGAVEISGIPFYRVNSLAGEPRDFGTFLLGAIFFYAYARYGKFRLFTKLNIILMICAFLLTTSNSAFLASGLFLIVIIADVFYRRRACFRLKYIKYVLVGLCLVVLVFRTQLFELVGARTISMVEAITAQLQTSEMQPLAKEQTFNLIIIYYILNLPQMPPANVLLGSGYSNFVTPLLDLSERFFDYHLEDAGIFTSDSFAVKLLIEGGVVGTALYLMMFLYTLKINSKILSFFKKNNDLHGYKKTLLLRLAFIAFFVSGAIQTSYCYFIIMGLIIGWANELYRKKLSQS